MKKRNNLRKLLQLLFRFVWVVLAASGPQTAKIKKKRFDQDSNSRSAALQSALSTTTPPSLAVHKQKTQRMSINVVRPVATNKNWHWRIVLWRFSRVATNHSQYAQSHTVFANNTKLFRIMSTLHVKSFRLCNYYCLLAEALKSVDNRIIPI